VAHLPAQCAAGVSLKISRGANVLELSEMLAGSTGLEPAASDVTGRFQSPHIAADPENRGRLSHVLAVYGRSWTRVSERFANSCKPSTQQRALTARPPGFRITNPRKASKAREKRETARFVGASQSFRSVVMGSTCVARKAGITADDAAATSTDISGSATLLTSLGCT
jgi:hypothetical protein